MQDFMRKIGRHRETKRHSRIGMYKKMHRVIEKEKGKSLVRVRDFPFSFSLLSIMRRYVNY